MGMHGDIDLHFWITRAMARKMGVNFSEAMHEGRLSQIGFTDLITRCRVCDKAQECLAYLSETDGPLTRAPDGCCNEDALNALVSRQA